MQQNSLEEVIGTGIQTRIPMLGETADTDREPSEEDLSFPDVLPEAFAPYGPSLLPSTHICHHHTRPAFCDGYIDWSASFRCWELNHLSLIHLGPIRYHSSHLV